MLFDFLKNSNEESARLGVEIGRNLAKGVGVGLSEDSYKAITSIENIYVQLESITKNAAKNAEKLEKKIQQRRLDNLKNSLQLGLVTEKEYYDRLKAFRDEYLSKGTDDWYKCTEEIAKYNKKMADEVEKQCNRILEIHGELSEQLKGSEEWSNSYKIRFLGMGQNGTDLVYNNSELKSFDKDIQALRVYHERINDLKKLGDIPEGIFSDIGKMDVEDAINAANAILMADEEKRKKFISDYYLHNSLAESIAGDLLGTIKADELRKEGINSIDGLAVGLANEKGKSTFAEILQAKFDEVPQSYQNLGEDAGRSFADGFLGSIPSLMENLKIQFATTINDIAENIAVAIRGAVDAVSQPITNNYSSTYTFNSSRDTTTQQLNAARNAATLERLRGGTDK